jgi:hypothetical protein
MHRAPSLLLLSLALAAPLLAAPTAPFAPDRPLTFEPNVGQAEPHIAYLARAAGYHVGVADRGIALRFAGTTEVFWLEPINAVVPTWVPERPLDGASHYVGFDTPSRSAAHFERIRAQDLWPGVDGVFYGSAHHFEYDFEVAPGADPGTIAVKVPHARLEEDGSLRLSAQGGGPDAVFAAPISYQLDADGERVPVASRYRLDADTLRFAVGPYDPTRTLVIDPVVVYSTYLGGGGVFSNQQIDAIASGPNGEAYVAGVTESAGFPIVNANVCDDELNDNTALNSCNGSPASVATDAFVAKLSADGSSLIYSTYIGGSGWDSAAALAVNAAGEAWIAGQTWDGFEATSRQAFVVRLNAAGTGAPFASVFGQSPPAGYFGYDYQDYATSLVLDGAGNAYVGGFTSSPGFHPAGVPGLDQTYAGAGDGFMRRYSNANVLTHSTYIGSPWFDDVTALGLAGDGSIFSAGTSFVNDNLNGDAYIIRLDGTLSSIVAGSTIITGTPGVEKVFDLAVDSSNRAWLVGETSSSNFCDGVPGGIDHGFGAPVDGYAFRISADLASVDTCTFIGANGCHSAQGIALSAEGVTITGGAQTGAVNCADDFDLMEAYLLRLGPNAESLTFSYAFGGPNLPDLGHDVAITPQGQILLAGMAGGPQFPVSAGAFQTTYPSAALRAGFVMKVDPVTRLSIDDASVTEGNSGTKNLGFTVRLNGYPLNPVGYTLTTANGTASAGSDYTARNSTCATCFAALANPTRTENVVIQGDTTEEPNETFTVTLSAPVNAVLGDGTATGTILNDDEAGSIRFAGATASVGEGAGSAAITLQRTGGTSGAVSVTCATTAGGTAAAGSDYTTTSATVSWANGDGANKTCSIPILEDTTDEPDETVNLALSNPTGGAVLTSPSTAVLTITDNDPQPAISITNTSVTEGNTGTVTASFSVTLDRASTNQITVAWASGGGTATAGSDYVPGSGTLTFSAGQTSKTITRAVNGDTLDESNETFNITLSSPTNATLADGVGTCTITDDDTAGSIQFYTATYSAIESGTQVVVTVNRSGGAASGASVAYAVTGGTATGGGVDYTVANGTLTFAAAETSRTFTIGLVHDTLDEPDETVVVTLSNPGGGATLGPITVYTLTIEDNDFGGLVQFQVAESSRSEISGTATLLIVRGSGAASGVSVDFAVTGGTATGGGVDYTLANGTVTFGANDSSKSIPITIVDDLLDEPDETIIITLSNPTGGASLGPITVHTRTIIDDDVASPEIFDDGFESGDLSAWSSHVP